MRFSFRAKLYETLTLLTEANETHWSGVLRDLLARYDQTPGEVRRSLLALYDAGGSFGEFSLRPNDGSPADATRRFERLRAELRNACVAEENAARGFADDLDTDYQRLATEVAIVALPLFLLSIAGSPTFGFYAGIFFYVATAIMSVAWSILLCASFRTFRTLRDGEEPEGPGQYVALGMGTMVGYYVLADLVFAIWSRVGPGIPAFDVLWLALSCAGVALPAAAMLFGVRKGSVEPPWRHALLAGAILFPTYLLPAGLYAMLWLTRLAVGPAEALEALAFLGYVIATVILGLGGLAWLAYVLGIYARERSLGERYPWMHYAPLVAWGLSLLSIATTAVQFAVSA